MMHIATNAVVKILVHRGAARRCPGVAPFPSKRWAQVVLVWLGLLTLGSAEPTTSPVALQVERVQTLLDQWQFVPAQRLAEELLDAYPELPAAQLIAGWVLFHRGDQQAAASLIDRAAAALGEPLEMHPRILLVRATAQVTRGFVRMVSPGGQVEVWHAPGVDEILVPDLIDTVSRTVATVGEDLGYHIEHPVVVQILPQSDDLAVLTGLTQKEIRTSGTIAVCKYGRLMVTSPRATLLGYSWLDTVSHELVHMLISEKTYNRTPIWLHEALAKFEDSRFRHGEPLYREGLPPYEESLLAAAVRTNTLITFEQMHPSMALLPSQEAAALAFAEVFMAAEFLYERGGYPKLRTLLSVLGSGRSDYQAIEQVYGLSEKDFVAHYREWLRQQPLRQLRADALLDRREPLLSSDAVHLERSLTRTHQLDLRDFFHLGQLLRAQNRPAASVIEFQKAVQKTGPDNAARSVLQDKLGLALLAIGQLDQARPAFEDSLRNNPQDLEAHRGMGAVLRKDDPYKAFLHLKEALRINPLDPRIHAQLGEVSQALAASGDHREDWRALIERHRRALRLLTSMRPQPREPAAVPKE
jgi:tetratricopeptide (TPR) repeat protein